MAFCYRCGTEVHSQLPYCSTCGAELQPKAAEPINAVPFQAEPLNAEPVKKVDGGVRGRSIASVVLGGEGLGISVAAWYFILFQFMFSAILSQQPEFRAMGSIFYIYVFVFAVIALASGIVGTILSRQALAKVDGYRLAKTGKILSLIVVILSATALVFGFLMALATFL